MTTLTRKAQIEAAAAYMLKLDRMIQRSLAEAEKFRLQVEEYPQTHPQRILKAHYAGEKIDLADRLDTRMAGNWDLLEALGIADQVREEVRK